MTDGLKVEFDFREAVELAQAWRQAPEIVAQEMTVSQLEAGLLLEREIKELTPVGVGAGGGLKGSISAREPEVLADSVIGVVGTSLAHAIPVELGSKPHLPPLQPIEDWVRAKLGVPVQDVKGVAFAVARKIAREGTEGAFMFTKAFEANQGQLQRIFAAGLARIRARLAAAGGAG